MLSAEFRKEKENSVKAFAKGDAAHYSAFPVLILKLLN